MMLRIEGLPKYSIIQQYIVWINAHCEIDSNEYVDHMAKQTITRRCMCNGIQSTYQKAYDSKPIKYYLLHKKITKYKRYKDMKLPKKPFLQLLD